MTFRDLLHGLDTVIVIASLLALPILLIIAQKWHRTRHLLVFLCGLQFFKPIQATIWGLHEEFIHKMAIQVEVRGFEISLVDVFCIGLFVQNRQRRLPRGNTQRLLILRIMYLGSLILSLSNSRNVDLSLFVIVKLLRMYFAFEVLATALAETGAISAALSGLAIAFVAQLPIQVLQRLLHLGGDRAAGSFPQANSLSMAANLVLGPAMLLFLSGRGKKYTGLTVFVIAVLHLLSGSRAGMILFVGTFLIGSAASLAMEPTRAKIRRVGAMLAIGCALTALGAPLIIQRIYLSKRTNDPALLERKHLAAAARLMFDNHPWGVGANNFTEGLKQGNYAARAGLEYTGTAYLVHNTYWLVAAETGYAGLISYLSLVLGMIMTALRGVKRRDAHGDLALGVAISIFIMSIHSFMDCAIIFTRNAYLLWMLAAIAVATVEIRARGTVRAAPEPRRAFVLEPIARPQA